jgi:DUF1680 family protein
VNRARQQLAATPGQYVSIDRKWKTGDKIEIAMPLSFRTERTIDDATARRAGAGRWHLPRDGSHQRLIIQTL